MGLITKFHIPWRLGAWAVILAGMMKPLLRLLHLAPYGADELFLALVTCGATAVALGLLWRPLALLPLLPLAVVIWFFRDPERNIPQAAELLLAPADGRVTDVQEVEEAEFIGGRALRIGIFLSPLNVHVNRAPCEGIVRLVRGKAGEFLPAYDRRAPERNESVVLGLECVGGVRLVVKQISGMLARRIVCEAEPGQVLGRGERYGMIKFGSRTELYVPLSLGPEPLVVPGDRVQGGVSPCVRVDLRLQVEPLTTKLIADV